MREQAEWKEWTILIERSPGLSVVGLVVLLSGCLGPIHEGSAQGLAIDVTLADPWDQPAADHAANTLAWNVTALEPEGIQGTAGDAHGVQMQVAEFGIGVRFTYVFEPKDVIRRENVTLASDQAIARSPPYSADAHAHLAAFENATGWRHEGELHVSCLCSQP